MEDTPRVSVWLEGLIEDADIEEDPPSARLDVTVAGRMGRRRVTVLAEGGDHVDNIRANIGNGSAVLVRATPSERDGCDLEADSIAFAPSHRDDA